ncbi:MAG: hypothetical protein R6V50_07620 [Thermoplasmatota archaeon]
MSEKPPNYDYVSISLNKKTRNKLREMVVQYNNKYDTKIRYEELITALINVSERHGIQSKDFGIDEGNGDLKKCLMI